MNLNLLLSESDYADLRALLHHRIPGLYPHPAPIEKLTQLLSSSSRSNDSEQLQRRVCLHDEILLVPTGNDHNWESFRVVLPGDASTSGGRLSILSPAGFALIGRKIGDAVTWNDGKGERVMEIRAIRKAMAVA